MFGVFGVGCGELVSGDVIFVRDVDGELGWWKGHGGDAATGSGTVGGFLEADKPRKVGEGIDGGIFINKDEGVRSEELLVEGDEGFIGRSFGGIGNFIDGHLSDDGF